MGCPVHVSGMTTPSGPQSDSPLSASVPLILRLWLAVVVWERCPPLIIRSRPGGT
jgi:hypothetical protein